MPNRLLRTHRLPHDPRRSRDLPPPRIPTDPRRPLATVYGGLQERAGRLRAECGVELRTTGGFGGAEEGEEWDE